MENELVCAWIQSIPICVLSIVVQIVLRVVVVARFGVVVKARRRLKYEPSLLVGVLHGLSLDLIHKVENVLFCRGSLRLVLSDGLLRLISRLGLLDRLAVDVIGSRFAFRLSKVSVELLQELLQVDCFKSNRLQRCKYLPS